MHTLPREPPALTWLSCKRRAAFAGQISNPSCGLNAVDWVHICLPVIDLVWITSPLGRFSILLSGGEEETLQQFRARRTSSTHCSGHAESLYLFGFSSFRLFGFHHISAIPWWSIPKFRVLLFRPIPSFCKTMHFVHLFKLHTVCTGRPLIHSLTSNNKPSNTMPYIMPCIIKHHQTSDTTVEAISVSHKWAGHIEVSSAKDALRTRGIYKVLIFD